MSNSMSLKRRFFESQEQEEEEELMLLFCVIMFGNEYKPNPLVPDVIFRLDDYDPVTIHRFFRFERAELYTLLENLRLPDVVILESRHRVTSLDALCITLRRLSYPSRFIDLMAMFGDSEGTLSRIFNYLARYIYTKF
jgi:hypothetical protein